MHTTKFRWQPDFKIKQYELNFLKSCWRYKEQQQKSRLHVFQLNCVKEKGRKNKRRPLILSFFFFFFNSPSFSTALLNFSVISFCFFTFFRCTQIRENYSCTVSSLFYCRCCLTRFFIRYDYIILALEWRKKGKKTKWKKVNIKWPGVLAVRRSCCALLNYWRELKSLSPFLSC